MGEEKEARRTAVMKTRTHTRGWWEKKYNLARKIEPWGRSREVCSGGVKFTKPTVVQFQLRGVQMWAFQP